ncbi:MAG: hypothetical protein ACTSPD_13225 [Promethearchaeota archaeon]
MEIEKKRETTWKIQLKEKKENIELTSIEISGEVRTIKIALKNKDNSLSVEMKKEEFFNFLSLLSAFKDVVLGDVSFILSNERNLLEKKKQEIQEQPERLPNLYNAESEPSKEPFEKGNMEGLNPEEWDPW